MTCKRYLELLDERMVLSKYAKHIPGKVSKKVKKVSLCLLRLNQAVPLSVLPGSSLSKLSSLRIYLKVLFSESTFKYFLST